MRKGTIPIVPQRTQNDCAIACLAMMGSTTYEDVVAVCPKLATRDGLSEEQRIAVAKRLGLLLERARIITIFNDHGILSTDDHSVILWNGFVIDTLSRIWMAEAWLKIHTTQETKFSLLKEK